MNNTQHDVRIAVSELNLYIDILAEEIRRDVDNDEPLLIWHLARRAKFLMLRVLEWDEGNVPVETFKEADRAYKLFINEITSRR